MCPDIEIGMVRRILGEVMAAEIKTREILEKESYQWVLGQLLVSPMGEVSLAEDWYETNRRYQERIQPPNDNYEDEGYQKVRLVGVLTRSIRYSDGFTGIPCEEKILF